jgi:hypothetical protein
MVVGVHEEPRSREMLAERPVPPGMLSHTVGELHCGRRSCGGALRGVHIEVDSDAVFVVEGPVLLALHRLILTYAASEEGLVSQPNLLG